MTQESAVILLIVSWVVSFFGTSLAFAIDPQKSKHLYLIVASTISILALVAYFCYLVFYLPYA